MTNTLQQRISGAAGPALTLVAVLVLGVVTTHSAQAQTFTVLYNFRGSPDGGLSYNGLVRDAGNLYGTTAMGGISNLGTVFKLDKHGEETVLYSFTGKFSGDGQYPFSALVRDHAGNLYGTTANGGASDNGTVFKVDTTGSETVLYSFSGADGANPIAGLVRDAAGNLYGTTHGGGAYGYGTVFKLDTKGTETVLHSFFGGSDGGNSYGGLIRDASGHLYGTTQGGGGTSSSGVVFKLDKAGNETVLYSFTGTGGDGANPCGGLLRDRAGNLYGTTSSGGAFGLGTVFKVDPSGTETVLHSFSGSPDGANPYAGLIQDRAGRLYGTTAQGGASNYGTVFKLDKSGKETVLHSFTVGTDGGILYGGLVRDRKGKLYGTTNVGGIGLNVA